MILLQEVVPLVYGPSITSSDSVWAQSSCLQAPSLAWPHLKLIFEGMSLFETVLGYNLNWIVQYTWGKVICGQCTALAVSSLERCCPYSVVCPYGNSGCSALAALRSPPLLADLCAPGNITGEGGPSNAEIPLENHRPPSTVPKGEDAFIGHEGDSYSEAHSTQAAKKTAT